MCCNCKAIASAVLKKLLPEYFYIIVSVEHIKLIVYRRITVFMNGRLLDILLLPRSFYERFTDKKPLFYAGVLLAGAIDILFPLFARYMGVFQGKSGSALNFNVGMAVLFIVLFGIIDAMFFTIPIFDLIKFLKRIKIDPAGPALIKFAKVYIMAHVVTLPFNVLVNLMFYFPADPYKLYPDIVLVIIIVYSFFIMPAWFSGIISRGANVLFGIEKNLKPLVFASIYTWNYILGTYAFDYMFKNWVMRFFM